MICWSFNYPLAWSFTLTQILLHGNGLMGIVEMGVVILLYDVQMRKKTKRLLPPFLIVNV